jgi:glycogen debranching enzyme
VSEPWTFSGQPVSTGRQGGSVTLVDESTFVISDALGDVVPGGAHGLFVRDTRVLSRWELLLDGRRPEQLGVVGEDPFSAVFVARARPRGGRADSTLLVLRTRHVGRGMRDEVTVRNYGAEPTFCRLELFVGADFADLFAVKEGRVANGDGVDGERTVAPSPDGLLFELRRGGVSRGCRLRWSTTPAAVAEDLVAFEVIVPARGEWRLCTEVHPVIDQTAVEPRYRCGQPVERAEPSERLARWRRRMPQVEVDHEGWGQVVQRSVEDLGALRIFDPEFPDRVVVAAGAPWFMTIFGRDSLLTAWMALLVDPDVALGVVQTLARFQGDAVDARTEEEPGRILHEMRFGEAPSLALGGGSIYYGTADATPLFVMLIGELRRWGLAREVVDELLPNVERAMTWIETYGDRDGDGYVEYLRATDRGLANQGWKDSWDGVRYADGRVATAPIALCEVQAYVYGAYLASAHFARERGDDRAVEHWRAKAATLKQRFNEDFWLEQHGWYAMGLDADKRPIDALASNMGHCLWTGIVDEERAPLVAERLLSDELFSGWGVRTLATSMGGYNPVSYHCGSVWPHDTAIVAAGLARYGMMDEALRLVAGLFDAAMAFGGRLPELFAGLDRNELAVPVAYPTSCSPQAWAAAAPLLCLRTILRLDPWVPQGVTWVAPVLPDGVGRLAVRGIPLGGARVDVLVEGDHVVVEGVPDGLELRHFPRHPGTAV